jgi:hypothetical protein
MKMTKNNINKLVFIVFAFCALSACNFEVETTKGGTVISDPAGINCRYNSGSCIVKNYERLGDSNDEIVTKLTAIPDEGYRFSHWKGCYKTSLLNCYKEMAGEIYVEAVFTPISYETSAANAGSVRFIALGDFGTGDVAQKTVGDAVARECNNLGGCDFAIGLGDNIYDENPQQTDDDAFERKFEYPFINIDFPFYMTLGNHDNSLLIDGFGNFNHSGDVQVAYSYKEDRLSEKWIMPARYYEHAHPANTSRPLVEFFVLDSNPFMSTLEVNPEYLLFNYKREQAEWIQNALSNSNASWKIAYAHHPFLSNGQHGNAGNYDGVVPVEYFTTRISGEIYRKWLVDNVCNKVDIFVAGHDHDLQLLHSVPECGNTIFVVSGAGAKVRPLDDPSRNPVMYQRGNQLGFVMAEIVGNSIALQFYNVNATTGQATIAHQQSFSRRKIN